MSELNDMLKNIEKVFVLSLAITLVVGMVLLVG